MLIENTIDFFLSMNTAKVLAYFWPFFLMDMTRYLLLDVVVIGIYAIKRVFQRDKYKTARRQLYKERPLVSLLIPGKNEGKHIPRLAESLTRQTYKNIEIIIVDDGSDDNTAEICRRLEQEGKIDRFIRNEVRGGKASAANTALAYSNGKYLVHIEMQTHIWRLTRSKPYCCHFIWTRPSVR